jgi:hypothetical protein
VQSDGAKLLKRCDQLKTRRSVVEERWRECYNLTYPLRGVGFETMGQPSGDAATQHASTASSRQAELLDSTGTDGVRILASALMAGLTPANSRWPSMEVDQQTDEERRWLDQSADIVWTNIHASNFDAVGFECMLDMAIAGMFPMFVDEAPGGGYRFEEWPLAHTYFASSRSGGPVDTVFNEFTLSAEQAVNEYGENMLSEKARELAATKPDEQLNFVRCVYPRSGPSGKLQRNLPIASVHIEKDSKQIVRESGYHEMPIGVPRWSPVPGSAYAFGPAFEALPDMKTLNTVVSYVLSNADMAISGMWGAVDDGVLNPRMVRVGPRKIIVMAEKDNMWPMSPAAKFDIAVLEIDRLQRAIRKVLMADQLEPQQKAGTPPTATEIVVRVELIRQLLGPVYGRMQSEYLQWLVARCFGLAYRAGVLGTPPRSLMNKVLTVKYFSPIARAQKAVDVAAMDRYELSLSQQAQAGLADAVDVYNWDEARRERAELLGVPAKLIPDQDVIDEKRESRAKQRQTQQVAQQATELAAKVAA